MIKGVKFVSIPTKDQDKSLAFYTSVLGWSVFTDQPFMGDARWIELKIPGADTRVVLFKTPPEEEYRVGKLFYGAFACDDVEATYEQLKGRGVEFIQAPQRQPGGTFAIFADPEGNQFVLSNMGGRHG